MRKLEKQDYGSNPLEVRESDQYQLEYIEKFAKKWDELINWHERSRGEGTFFIDVLKKKGVERVLDVATGTGYHSVQLMEAGFDVVSADGSPEMLYRAFENGKEMGHLLQTVQIDWRWLNQGIHEKFDAVICLGNSFTHLFSENDRRKALAEFYSVLRHDGILILDQRNYDAILDSGYSSKHKYYYCGNDVEVEPEYTDDGLARFRYHFEDDSVYYLNMFPLRCKYTQRLMKEVGFQRINTYGDFQETEKREEPDFYIHVAEKKYLSQ
ncbi:glycine/sarcosine N-methyltransferase [Membranihabitans maritimus]|uniref:glycine/sarcosine N-methyltransferase n=1 Tax=Membranihabitans maritimus TaxID=2904244 RepID=UPI001F45FF10